MKDMFRLLAIFEVYTLPFIYTLEHHPYYGAYFPCLQPKHIILSSSNLNHQLNDSNYEGMFRLLATFMCPNFEMGQPLITYEVRMLQK